jgi:hypothetical protein
MQEEALPRSDLGGGVAGGLLGHDVHRTDLVVVAVHPPRTSDVGTGDGLQLGGGPGNDIGHGVPLPVVSLLGCTSASLAGSAPKGKT